jgi:hypothetical protein
VIAALAVEDAGIVVDDQPARGRGAREAVVARRRVDELQRDARPRYHISFPDPVARPIPALASTPK